MLSCWFEDPYFFVMGNTALPGNPISCFLQPFDILCQEHENGLGRANIICHVLSGNATRKGFVFFVFRLGSGCSKRGTEKL